MQIPFLDLAAQRTDLASEVRPVSQQQFATAGLVEGAEADALEKDYAEYMGEAHVVGVSNGSRCP